MATVRDEELEPEQTEGFKVSEGKTLEEYQKLGRSSTFLAIRKGLLVRTYDLDGSGRDRKGKKDLRYAFFNQLALWVPTYWRCLATTLDSKPRTPLEKIGSLHEYLPPRCITIHLIKFHR